MHPLFLQKFKHFTDKTSNFIIQKEKKKKTWYRQVDIKWLVLQFRKPIYKDI